MSRLKAAMLAAALAGAPAQGGAAEPDRHHRPDLSVTVATGYGRITANELFFIGDQRVSQRIWEAALPMASVAARVGLAHGWFVSIDGTAGFAGDSTMLNYVWGPLSPGSDFDDWSDRSVHAATILDHYFNLEIALGRAFALSPTLQLDVHAGLKHVDAGWSAYGGEFILSRSEFRDTFEVKPEDERIVSMRETLPGAFLGLGALWQRGRWSLSGHLRGGVAFSVEAASSYALTGFEISHIVDSMPFISLAAQADYRFADNATIWLGGSLDHYLRRRGRMVLAVGGETETIEDAIGLDFSTIAIHAGFSLHF